MKNRLALSIALISLLLVAACSSDDSAPVAGAQNAPNSLAGATIQINPTINFIDNLRFSYSSAPTAAGFPEGDFTGTFTYVRQNAQNSILTLDFDGGVPASLILELTNFRGTANAISTFDVNLPTGQVYVTRVTGGTVAPGPGNGGGGGAETPGRVADSVIGTYDLVFQFAQPGSPFPDGTEKTFVIGATSLAFDGKTLTNPVFLNGNEFEAIFKDGAVWYAVSERNGGGLNEINVAGSGGAPFFGQFADPNNFDPSDVNVYPMTVVSVANLVGEGAPLGPNWAAGSNQEVGISRIGLQSIIIDGETVLLNQTSDTFARFDGVLPNYPGLNAIITVQDATADPAFNYNFQVIYQFEQNDPGTGDTIKITRYTLEDPKL